MNLIPIKQIYDLLVQICNLLNKNKIEYLIHGSVAKNLLVNKKQKVNDIDILISEKDFSKIDTLLNKDFDLSVSNFNIHANSKEYLGTNNKPFDISFDSYEHYFQRHNVNISEGIIKKIEGVEIKVISPRLLDIIYKLHQS